MPENKIISYPELVSKATGKFLSVPSFREQGEPPVAMTALNAAFSTLDDEGITNNKKLTAKLLLEAGPITTPPINNFGHLLQKLSTDIRANDPEHTLREAARRTLFPHRGSSGYC